MSEILEARTDTRRRRKAERPQEILEAAFVEFSRNGYAMTTLDRVAEHAGVTKGTIYVYFENKEHLFISMVREVTKTALDTVHEMLETTKARPPICCAPSSASSTSTSSRTAAAAKFAHADRGSATLPRARRPLSPGNFAPLPRHAAPGDPARHGPRRIPQFRDRRLPQIVIAPIALVDLWMMMFDDRQPLDLKAYFNAHLDLVLNGLLAK